MGTAVECTIMTDNQRLLTVGKDMRERASLLPPTARDTVDMQLAVEEYEQHLHRHVYYSFKGTKVIRLESKYCCDKSHYHGKNSVKGVTHRWQDRNYSHQTRCKHPPLP